jgi:hypothetical protein
MKIKMWKKRIVERVRMEKLKSRTRRVNEN